MRHILQKGAIGSLGDYIREYRLSEAEDFDICSTIFAVHVPCFIPTSVKPDDSVGEVQTHRTCIQGVTG
jgi:hypothetical protein